MGEVTRVNRLGGDHLTRTARPVTVPAGFLGKVAGYCDAQGCMAREVVVSVKHLSGPPVARVVRCPLCGTPLIPDFTGWLHDRKSLLEEEEREALRTVAMLTFQREHGHFVPAGLFVSGGTLTVSLNGAAPVTFPPPGP
jgi:hypothetical protein